MNQKGFSAVQAILMLVILGIVGFAGWYVYSANNKTSDLLSNNTSDAKFAQKEKSVTKNTEALKTYTDSTEGISFKYPSDWSLKTTPVSGGPKGSVYTYVTSPDGGTVLSYTNYQTSGYFYCSPQAVCGDEVRNAVLKTDSSKYGIEELIMPQTLSGKTTYFPGMFIVQYTPGNDQEFATGFTPKNSSGKGGAFVLKPSEALYLDSLEEAKAFYTKGDGKTALQIMKSLTQE